MKDKIGKDDIKRAVSNVPLFDAKAFGGMKGEKVTGGAGNVLKIPVNRGAGPFTVTNVEERTLDKKYNPVMVWTAAAPDGIEYNMPAATSFVSKATRSRLSIGDVFVLFRNEDYRARGKDCQSFTITITSRAGGKGAKR